jgi:hypothetical protein
MSQSSMPFNDAASPLPRDRSPTAIAVDNLIRRRLRISDPRNAREVADGLQRLFPTDRLALEREASGLPLLKMPAIATPSAASGPSSAELEQATDDVERDLKALVTNSQLKDVDAELEGWGQAIRGLIADGTAVARFALDPRSRDRAFAARRQLGDYARMARLVGALTPNVGSLYRRLAQSLDEVAALILVLIGESLASVGMNGGRFLLSAPASELQARRDAALAALRNLNGSTQDAYGPADWPYGLHGLRETLTRLEASGHADLRALLDENTLARLMDELLDRASVTNARGLRALGATAQVAVQRLQRLVHVINLEVDPETPPLASFLKALQLFIDAFQGSTSGYRLLFIARPPVVFYGLYGIGGPDVATQRLINVIVERGRLAELLDCYLGCECCEDEVICQVLLDKLLYDTDRAIDLITLGSDPAGNGEPERRAAAYGWLVQTFLANNQGCLQNACFSRIGELQGSLAGIQTGLLANSALAVPSRPAAEQELIRDELCLQRQTDQQWAGLVATMAPSCIRGSQALGAIDTLLAQALGGLTGITDPTTCPAASVTIPPTLETSMAGLTYFRFSDGTQPTVNVPLRGGLFRPPGT